MTRMSAGRLGGNGMAVVVPPHDAAPAIEEALRCMRALRRARGRARRGGWSRVRTGDRFGGGRVGWREDDGRWMSSKRKAQGWEAGSMGMNRKREILPLPEQHADLGGACPADPYKQGLPVKSLQAVGEEARGEGGE